MVRRSFITVASVALASLASACTIEVVDTLVGSRDEVGEGEEVLDGATVDGSAGEDEGGEGGRDEGLPTPLFDVGDEQPQISSCQFAAQFPSHLGCEFYGVDLDQAGLFDFDPYGFVVVNPLEATAVIELARHTGRAWEAIEIVELEGEDEHVFLPTNNQVYGTGPFPGAVYRIGSDQPVVVIQASPAAGQGYSSSATMLQPAAAWTAQTRVAGWRTHEGVGERSFLSVVGWASGTPVTLDLSFTVEPGVDVEWSDNPLQINLEPGELARLDAVATDDEIDHGVSGTRVSSGQEHPMAVFSAHTCAAIPDYQGSCGHMQEQLVSRLVGRRFVAPRMVAAIDPDVGAVFERTMVQVVATEDDTTVEFIHDDGQVLETVMIDPDEPYAVYQAEHDLAVIADKPIVASAYMTNAEITGQGSPSMVQLAPVEQWTSYHWVWVPEGFTSQLLVSSSNAASVTVEQISTLDTLGGGPPLPGPMPVQSVVSIAAEALGSRELARVPVGPGIYRVASGSPSSVVVAGWRSGDGFAYLGGWGALVTEPAG